MIKKSQASVEFLIITGFVLFIFTSFFIAINESSSDKINQRQNTAVQEVALTIQDEINLAFKSSDGYSRNFKIPDKINSQEYSVNITDNVVYVKTNDNKYALALPVKKINGTIQKGENLIQKQNDTIYLNK